MKASFFAIILILFTLISCGKSEGTKSVKLKIVSAAMFSSIPNAGGVLVVGRTLDDKNSFSKAISSDSDLIDLPKGTWEFFAIAWEGDANAIPNKNLTGAHRCGYSGIVNIDKEDMAVTFNMSQVGCSQAVSDGTFVADPALMVGNQFKSVNFVDCSIIPGSLSSGSCTSTDKGLGRSMRIRYPDVMELNGVKKVIGAGLVSRCIDESSYYGSYSYLTLPIGTGNNGFVEFLIESYEGTSCTGAVKVSSYSHNNSGSDRAQLFDNGYVHYLFFPHYSPFGSLGYDDSTFSGNVVFNSCHKLTIKLKDLNANLINANQNISLSVNATYPSKILFFPNNSCTLGTGILYPTVQIAQGASTVDVYFKAFSNSIGIDVNAYSLGFGFNYSKSVNIASFNYATLTVTQLKEISEVANGSSSIMPAHTLLTAGSVVILRYDNIISKINVISIDVSSINFTAETFDYSTGSLVTSVTSSFLDTAMNEICDLTNATCNVATYTGSDVGYHLIYNSVNNLGVYAAGSDRSLFYLQ